MTICTYNKHITGSTKKYVGYYNMYIGYLLLLFEIKNYVIYDKLQVIIYITQYLNTISRT